MWILLLGLICHLAAASLYPYRDAAPLFLSAVAACFAFQLFALHRLRRRRWSSTWFWTTCLVIRLVWIAYPPGLSEDVYRYLWDGSLGAEGHNPYLETPANLPDVQQRRPQLYERMAHVDRGSIYPPAAQFLFTASVLTGGTSLVVWKLLLLAFEGLLVLIWRRAGRRRPAPLALWLLHPLAVIEFYSSGHLDLVGIVWMTASLAALTLAGGALRALAAGALCGLGTMTKVFPVFSVPALIRRFGVSGSFLFAAGFLIAAATVAGAFAAIWGHSLESATNWLSIMGVYHATWRFNSLPFFLFPDHRQVLQWGAMALLAALALRIGLPLKWGSFASIGRFGRLRDLRNGAGNACLLFAVLYAGAHTMHPWYVTWGLSLVPLADPRFRAVRYLSATAMASYLLYWLNPPGDRLWLLAAEWLPFYLLLYRDLKTVRFGKG